MSRNDSLPPCSRTAGDGMSPPSPFSKEREKEETGPRRSTWTFLKNFLKHLGPGIIFAGVSIGTSHIVQSTKAGADFGFWAAVPILLASAAKFPLYEAGTRYAAGTGESLLVGYRKRGVWVLVIFLVYCLFSTITTTATISLVTSGIGSVLFEVPESFKVLWMAGLVGLVNGVVLLIGKFRFLDVAMKVVSVVFILSTLAAFFAAVSVGPQHRSPSLSVSAFVSGDGMTELISLMGWIPTFPDVSVWLSEWQLEKERTIQRRSGKEKGESRGTRESGRERVEEKQEKEVTESYEGVDRQMQSANVRGMNELSQPQREEAQNREIDLLSCEESPVGKDETGRQLERVEVELEREFSSVSDGGGTNGEHKGERKFGMEEGQRRDKYGEVDKEREICVDPKAPTCVCSPPTTAHPPSSGVAEVFSDDFNDPERGEGGVLPAACSSSGELEEDVDLGGIEGKTGGVLLSGYRDMLLDFRIGYMITTVLAIVFLTLGRLAFFGRSGEPLNQGAVQFASQFVKVYTDLLGQWCHYVILVAAFSAMWSSAIGAMDGYVRTVAGAVRVLGGPRLFSSFAFWLVYAVGGSFLLLWGVGPRLHFVVAFTTGQAFCAAFPVALVNLLCLKGPEVSSAVQYGRLMEALCWIAIVLLAGLMGLFVVNATGATEIR
uniref:Uncharacterized protein n=1 Tax=Chromera velia CCMP2878 TaxID=1169474 RepID=A0A0G4F4Y5_9ALVE|eukprot:Cvel_15057.t1-p1 / transcript=Cvel_15057.t1 / gene=Cvel_15057 / organism=Chromera_velia_CCMP2878 / gene_product=Uncharacterized protein PM0681, putative / transcript_product=Uncharacterized protein PM0681, putative / location=Cvel_scaffold1097:11322-14313(-) / protein_length=661 / sequence_SO=supercontig / SO=protein_coding / is_pseudo=false